MTFLTQAFVQDTLDLYIAGSTCLSWSKMGLKDGWAALSALPFMVVEELLFF